MTKYFGMSLIPLLLLYSLFSKQGSKQRVLFFLIPVAILCAYQWGTKSLYGRGLLLDAAEYATSTKKYEWHNTLSSLLTGLSFTGGCLIPTMFFAPRLWGRRALFTWAALIPLLALVLSQLDLPTRPNCASRGYFLQLALFIVAWHSPWRSCQSGSMGKEEIPNRCCFFSGCRGRLSLQHSLIGL